MIKKFILLITLFSGILIGAQEKKININESKIKWIGKEITTKIHFGSLQFNNGKIILNNDQIVGGDFSVDMKSLVDEDLSGKSKQYLENHLKSDDFFGVEKYPTASLNISSSNKISNNEHKINAILTIKNIAHPISFVLTFNDLGAFAKMTFDRSKYDVKFRSASFFSDLGDKLIYDDIDVEVNLIFWKSKIKNY